MRDPRSPDPPKASPEGRLADGALARLCAAFERAGWKSVASRGGSASPDALYRRGKATIAANLKVAPGRARRPVLRGRLADAILEAQASARDANATPLAILAAPAISDGIAGELAAYVARVAPSMAWGLLDERGRFELHGKGLEGLRPPERSALPHSPPPAPPPLHNPFSDLGQWMLKVLLAERVPEEWLSAPRRRLRGVADLAEAARVSPASASRFLAALEAEGYLAPAPGQIRLVRVRALLDAWRRALQRPMERRYARFLLPGGDPYEKLQQVLAGRARERGADPDEDGLALAGPIGERVCLGLFAASRALGAGFVHGAPIHLVSENLSPEFLQGLEIVPVGHHAESELVILRPRFPEAVFRACVPMDGAPVADLLQSWLDVSFHAARGEEQADEIAARLKLEDWNE